MDGTSLLRVLLLMEIIENSAKEMNIETCSMDRLNDLPLGNVDVDFQCPG